MNFLLNIKNKDYNRCVITVQKKIGDYMKIKHNGGFTVKSPILNKRGQAKCPKCGRFIEFDESIDEKNIKWHYWTCRFCWSFSEHGHNTYDESSLRYNDSSKECYIR